MFTFSSIDRTFPFLKKSSLIIGLLVNFVTWTYILRTLMYTFLNLLELSNLQVFTYEGVFHFSIFLFLVFGGFVAERINTSKALVTLTIIESFVTLLPIFLGNITREVMFLICILWGMSIGVGIPSYLSYFSDIIGIEDRGKASGLTLFITFILVGIIGIIQLGPKISSILFTIWRICGLFFLPYIKKQEIKRKIHPLFSIIHNKVFIFYFIPSIIFFLVDTIEQPIIANFFSINRLILIKQIGLVTGSLSTILASFFMDIIGRKKTILLAFVIHGIGYAILSLSMVIDFSWFFFAVVDGVAWGILTPAFMLILWGDISPQGAKERFYALGSTPVSIGGVTRAVLAPYLSVIRIESSFSLASFFLFLAIIPLLFAPETLPEKVLRKRQIINYGKQVKKLTEKMRT